MQLSLELEGEEETIFQVTNNGVIAAYRMFTNIYDSAGSTQSRGIGIREGGEVRRGRGRGRGRHLSGKHTNSFSKMYMWFLMQIKLKLLRSMSRISKLKLLRRLLN